jgi:hypothetical protein
MATPRPRPRQSQQTSPKVQLIERLPDPQITFLVHREVMDQMPFQMAEALQQFMGCSIFIDFCKLNVAKCDKDLADLRPRPEWTNEQYIQLSRDMRLVWRFWTDLLQFAEEFKPK